MLAEMNQPSTSVSAQIINICKIIELINKNISNNIVDKNLDEECKIIFERFGSTKKALDYYRPKAAHYYTGKKGNGIVGIADDKEGHVKVLIEFLRCKVIEILHTRFRIEGLQFGVGKKAYLPQSNQSQDI